MLDDVNDNFLMQINKDDDKFGDDSGDVVNADDRTSSVCTGNSVITGGNGNGDGGIGWDEDVDDDDDCFGRPWIG